MADDVKVGIVSVCVWTFAGKRYHQSPRCRVEVGIKAAISRRQTARENQRLSKCSLEYAHVVYSIVSPLEFVPMASSQSGEHQLDICSS